MLEQLAERGATHRHAAKRLEVDEAAAAPLASGVAGCDRIALSRLEGAAILPEGDGMCKGAYQGARLL